MGQDMIVLFEPLINDSLVLASGDKPFGVEIRNDLLEPLVLLLKRLEFYQLTLGHTPTHPALDIIGCISDACRLGNLSME